MSIQRQIKKEASHGLIQARALLYSIESLPLPWLHDLIAKSPRKIPTERQQRVAFEKGRALLEKDSQEFADFDWPFDWLTGKKPVTHFSRWAFVMGDSAKSFLRRRNKQTRYFSKDVKNLDEFPKYYQQNFHHQTNGYLSEESANLYEHQVELLFRGLADPMRRRLLKPMIQKFKNSKSIRILELGCGTGTFTRFLADVFPQAQITAVDLSPSYIKVAKKRFCNIENVTFQTGDAADLLYKNSSFDAVVSVFLHHELPQDIRERVIGESLRVCRSDGFWGIIDSIQLGDDPDLDWAIKQFPVNFHEPFFTNYIKKPLKKLAQDKNSKRKFKERIHFLSKVVHSG